MLLRAEPQRVRESIESDEGSGLPIAYDRSNSVYPACTSLGRIRCFWRFPRLIESVTYALSTSLLVLSPPPLPAFSFTLQDLRKPRGSKRQQ